MDLEHGYSFCLPIAAGALSGIVAGAAAAPPGVFCQGTRSTSWANACIIQRLAHSQQASPFQLARRDSPSTAITSWMKSLPAFLATHYCGSFNLSCICAGSFQESTYSSKKWTSGWLTDKCIYPRIWLSIVSQSSVDLPSCLLSPLGQSTLSHQPVEQLPGDHHRPEECPGIHHYLRPWKSAFAPPVYDDTSHHSLIAGGGPMSTSAPNLFLHPSSQC